MDAGPISPNPSIRDQHVDHGTLVVAVQGTGMAASIFLYANAATVTAATPPTSVISHASVVTARKRTESVDGLRLAHGSLHRRRRQRAACELGDDLSGGSPVAARALLRGLEHVVVDVERGAHASDAIASRIRRQCEPISGSARDPCAPHPAQPGRHGLTTTHYRLYLR